ncbi:MAG: hypothetical protein GVY36_12920, partial [Verrucomicrobia bacterium]|nr:hypothetical protein [Verrucomicrobiota bacterium]
AMESRTDLPASVARQRLEFAYDSRSRRIQKTVQAYDSGTSSWTTTAQIKFLYDGWNLLAEYDAMNSDAVIRSHVWGLDLSGTPQGVGGVGGLLWSSQSGADYAPGFDANGNIIAWIDLSGGSLSGTAEYGAFGETLVQSGVSAGLPFGFSTKYEDFETGLFYYGFRYYSPNKGRWLGRDKIEESGGINLFAMLDNDSVNGVDYLGMGQALSWHLFAHWLGGSGTPMKLSWSDFDDRGTAKRAMKDEWVFNNLQTLKTLCKNAPDGRSHVNGPIGSTATSAFQNNATPFISQWRADAVNHNSGITIDHDCLKKECSMEFGLDLEAYDTADFNPGDSFGLWGLIQDDWLIRVRDDVPGVGADFRIYALDYMKTSHTVGYQ